MTILGAAPAPAAPAASGSAVAARRSTVAAILVPLATVVAIVALAVLPLLLPVVLHPLLSAARADAWLGVSPDVAHALSDATVRDLVLGGPFAVVGPDGRPLYGPTEVAHLRDARLLLWLALGLGAACLATLALRLRSTADGRATWRGIARGGAIAAVGTLLIGVVGAVAFDPLFELFHRVFFPGGNWAFDPGTQRLVQLYPFALWQLAAAGLGVGVLFLGAGTWLLGRRMGRAP